MSDIKTIPDATVVLLDLADAWNAGLPAEERFAGAARTTMPSPGSTSLPAVTIHAVDGAATQIDGYAVLDVQIFATRYTDASRLSREFDRHLMQYPHRVGSVLLDMVETVSIPTEVPWLEDNSIRRFQATYSVSFRR